MRKILKHTAFAAVLLTFIVGLVSCEKEKHPTSLEGTSWKLVGVMDIETGIMRDIDCKECYTLEFNTKNTFSGRNNYYRFWGSYTVDYSERSFHISQIDIEQHTNFGSSNFPFLQYATWATHFSHQKNELKLYYALLYSDTYWFGREYYLLFKPL